MLTRMKRGPPGTLAGIGEVGSIRVTTALAAAAPSACS